MSTFGKRLEELLEAAQMSQKYFSQVFTKWMQARKSADDKRKHTFSQQQISSYITGKARPDMDVIVGAAAFFSVSPLYMAGVSDDPNVEVAEAELTPEERGLLVQLRANDVLRTAVYNLLELTRPQGASALEKPEDHPRLPGSSEASQG